MPKFTITDAQKQAAITAAELGFPVEEICKLVVNPATGEPICKDTLRREVGLDMEVARVRKKVGLGTRCFDIAHSDRHKDSGQMAKFLAQTHLGWKPADRREHQMLDGDGNPTFPMLLVVGDDEDVEGEEAIPQK